MAVKSKNVVSISEKYISKQVLPYEQINCWLKWQSESEFDEIIITYPKNIRTISFLNTDEKVFKNYEPHSHECVIKKEWLQVEGFFGMKSIYEYVPSSTVEIKFQIKFIRKDTNQPILKENFVTTVTRPRIEYKNISTQEFVIDEYAKNISLKLELQLQVTENLSVRNIKGSQRIVTSNSGIKIHTKPDYSQIPEIALEPIKVKETLIVSGRGMAVVQITFQYEDFNGNKYSTDPIEITIEKRNNETIVIPIERGIESNVPLLVAN